MIFNISFSINREERIKKKKDFNNLFKNGNFIRGKFYNCLYLKNNFGYSRFGVVVKKRFGIAVKRNYEKRIIREFFRQYKDKLKSHFDLIFILTNSSAGFISKKEDYLKIISLIH